MLFYNNIIHSQQERRVLNLYKLKYIKKKIPINQKFSLIVGYTEYRYINIYIYFINGYKMCTFNVMAKYKKIINLPDFYWYIEQIITYVNVEKT